MLGLTVGQGAVWIEPALLPVLAVAMTLSVISISNRDLASLRNAPRPVLISLLLNYVAMGGIMLLMAKWLINDSEIWAGFVILAATPPATSVTAFSYMLGGNTVFSLIGMTGAYLASLGLTPSMMILLLGTNLANPIRLLLILVQLIIVPLAISRILIFKGLSQRIDKWRDTAINWCYFISIFIVIGLNRQVFFEQPAILLRIVIISTAFTFGLGHAIDFIGRRLHINRSTRISWMIMGTRKNAGLASVTALAFISQKAAIPAAICTLFSILYIVWLSFYVKKWVK